MPCGIHVEVEQPVVSINQLLVRGKMTFVEGLDIAGESSGILVCGELLVGSENSPHQSKVIFELTGTSDLSWRQSSHGIKVCCHS